jgi:hypothetical protein
MRNLGHRRTRNIALACKVYVGSTELSIALQMPHVFPGEHGLRCTVHQQLHQLTIGHKDSYPDGR